jgi:hypothetical protein
MARRRIRGLPEPPVPPVKLLVEENPNWPAAQEGLFAVPAEEASLWKEDETAVFAGLEEEPLEASAGEVQGLQPGPAAGPAAALEEDPSAAVIQQLMEDNRDLKAALCRLIRISEQNEAALRLLEEENEELSALAHRLTTGQTSVAHRQPSAGPRPWWQRGWGGEWLKRQGQRCI